MNQRDPRPESHHLDELARELASDTLSRRRVLKLAGAAIFGMLLGGSLLPEEAHARRRHRHKSSPTITICPPSGTSNCCTSPSCAPGQCVCPPGSTCLDSPDPEFRACVKPDLAPVSINGLPGPMEFCYRNAQGKLVVRVKNLGAADAPASITTVTFSPGGASSQNTPPIPAGGSTDLQFDIPGACFDADCEFTVTVDSSNQVSEADEGNNTASGTCIG